MKMMISCTSSRSNSSTLLLSSSSQSQSSLLASSTSTPTHSFILPSVSSYQFTHPRSPQSSNHLHHHYCHQHQYPFLQPQLLDNDKDASAVTAMAAISGSNHGNYKVLSNYSTTLFTSSDDRVENNTLFNTFSSLSPPSLPIKEGGEDGTTKCRRRRDDMSSFSLPKLLFLLVCWFYHCCCQIYSSSFSITNIASSLKSSSSSLLLFWSWLLWFYRPYFLLLIQRIQNQMLTVVRKKKNQQRWTNVTSSCSSRNIQFLFYILMLISPISTTQNIPATSSQPNSSSNNNINSGLVPVPTVGTLTSSATSSTTTSSASTAVNASSSIISLTWVQSTEVSGQVPGAPVSRQEPWPFFLDNKRHQQTPAARTISSSSSSAAGESSSSSTSTRFHLTQAPSTTATATIKAKATTTNELKTKRHVSLKQKTTTSVFDKEQEQDSELEFSESGNSSLGGSRTFSPSIHVNSNNTKSTSTITTTSSAADDRNIKDKDEDEVVVSKEPSTETARLQLNATTNKTDPDKTSLPNVFTTTTEAPKTKKGVASQYSSDSFALKSTSESAVIRNSSIISQGTGGVDIDFDHDLVAVAVGINADEEDESANNDANELISREHILSIEQHEIFSTNNTPSSLSSPTVATATVPVPSTNLTESSRLGDIINNSSFRILSQIRRDLSQRIGKGKVARVVNNEDFQLEDELDVQECDRVFVSTPGGPKNGTFESPKLIPEEDGSIQCIYTFVPRPGERVQIQFTHFRVRGIPPECVHEWIDLYTEVDGTDVTDLITTPFAGRYCGLIPPRPRISLFGGIAIGFYSDWHLTHVNLTVDDEFRFAGRYSFISEERYIVGTPVPRTVCSFTILGTSKRQGELRSPTYPGIYPKDLNCSYKFIGTPGQRIRIEFRDFDVFSGGLNCPFDDVKVYDGMDPTASLIGTYCGPQRYLVVFSSEHLMFVTFTTRERTFESQNRGFTALWEFSESFVKLDFIGKNAGTHIRGTECDQLILSKGQSSGAVYSPNYPFPYLPKIYCKYFIYGLQDSQNLERVKLTFEKFDVPSSAHSEEDLSSSGHHKEKESKCGDGHVKVYIKGQELMQAFDKPDFEFCGKDLPEEIASDQPRLVLAFSSGEIQGSGFKAKYAFEIEYRIPGTPAPDHSCHFTYRSANSKMGEFNSPRHPSNYPSNTTCNYLFIGESNEQVRIVFDQFKIRADSTENLTETQGAYGPKICTEDWVEIYNVFKTRSDRLIGRYCAMSAPGPIESHEEAEAIRIVLHTDEQGVYSGFKARYYFFKTTNLLGECGMNHSAVTSGSLTSPGWPGRYEGPKNREGSSRCNWFLTVRPGSRILLHFQIFSIEGHPHDRGCPAAAVRIWEDPEGLPIEICGEGLPIDSSQFVSVKNYMRMTFITADKAVGAVGFYAIWSEVHDRVGASTCQPGYFPCAKNPFCIPDELHCDGTNNCGNVEGKPDDSDESLCGLDSEVNVILILALSIASGSCCLLTLCIWGQRKRRKRRRRLHLRRPPIHVCDNAGARFAAMDSV